MDDEGLFTTGILLLSEKGELVFKALPNMKELEPLVNAQISRAQAAITDNTIIFEYMIQRGNGVTEDWSEEFRTEGKDADNAAAQVFKRATEHLAG